MNTKHCVYRNCGNTSAFATKITFFGFPLKDIEKCQLWAQMAGCEDINLKSKYLCENHFSTIYISKTPRRTVLLPNAIPYRWNENIDDEEYQSGENTSQEEMRLESMDDDGDIIYTDTIEMIRHNEDGNDENVDTIDEPVAVEEVHNINSKVKLNAIKMTKQIPKTYEPIGDGTKTIEKISTKRISLPSDELVNHVTKRQKLQTSSNNLTVVNQSNDSFKVDRKHDVDENKKSQIDTIDHPDITTFIYKGEEYIQMPKRVYLQQRIQLDHDIKRYRGIVENIKSLVNSTV